MSAGYKRKTPKGYINGKEAGCIVERYLSDAGLKRFGRNYSTLFSLIKKQTPTLNNGESGRAKRYYYKEERVRGLCRAFIEGMREIFEEETIGRWKEHKYGTTLDPSCVQYYCSVCNAAYEDYAPNYCPRCGAKMEGIDYE